MSGQRWRFTPAELQALWPLVGVSRVPFPLDVRSSARTVDEQRAERQHALDALARGGVASGDQLDPDLAAALGILVRPAVSLDATGFYADDGVGESAVVRVLVAAVRHSGVLAVQLPGPDARSGGDLVLETVAAASLPTVLVRSLPPAPAGTEAGVRVPRADLGPTRGDDAAVTHSPTLSAGQRAVLRLRELTTATLHGAGQIAATAGSRSGPVRECTVRWFDRADGRYLMRVDDAVTVTPASSAELVAAATEQLGVVTRRT